MLEAKRVASARSMDGHQANGVEFTAENKPRGFFSFLTWPFYLAQAVAAEAVVGGMLRPVLADEENGDTAKERLTPASNNDYETALREPGTASGAEEVGADARSELRATEIDANSAPTGVEVSPPTEVEAVLSSGAGAGGGNTRTGAAGANGSSAASSADAPSASSTHGEANSVSEVVPGDALTFHPVVNGGLHEAAAPVFEGIAPVVTATTPAATDVVGQGFAAAEVIIEAVPGALSAPASIVTDLIGVLESAPLVEGVAPVITAAQGFSTELVGNALSTPESLLEMATPLGVGMVAATTHAATDVVGQGFDVAEVIIEVVPGVLSAPSSTVTDLIGLLESAPLVEGVSSVTTAAQDSSAEFVGDTLGAAESLLGMATTFAASEHESRAETSSVSTAALTDIISIADEIGALPLGSLDASLGSGGIIKFEEPSSELSADELFAEGRHTDYGLSLRTDAVTEPISEVVDRTIQSDEGQASSVGPNTDGGQDAGLFKPTKTPDPAEASLVGDVTSTFEDIGLRGSDSLF